MRSNLVARFSVDISDLNKNHEVTPLNTFLDLLMDRIDALEERIGELENRASDDDETRAASRLDDLDEKIRDIETKLEDVPSGYEFDDKVQEIVRDLLADAKISIDI